MSDEAGFLKSIADRPADRTARLAYTDWLVEHDRAREAEFLRLQQQIDEANGRLIELGHDLDATWLAAVGNVRAEPDEFVLRSGRQIRLREFRQWHFYEGLLAGYPTSDQNREDLAALVRQEFERRQLEPHVLTPTERLVPPERARYGPCGLFPAVACVGRFSSFRPARDPNLTMSELTVIWFQDEFAFPIDPGARERIRAVDWEKHAHDFDW